MVLSPGSGDRAAQAEHGSAPHARQVASEGLSKSIHSRPQSRRIPPPRFPMKPSATSAQTLAAALSSELWYAQCEPEFQAALLTLGRLWVLSDGERLFHRGAVEGALCCVTAGALRVGGLQRALPVAWRDLADRRPAAQPRCGGRWRHHRAAGAA